MDVQTLIVILVVAGAIVFAGVGFIRRSRSFTARSGCEADCGCSGKSKQH